MSQCHSLLVLLLLCMLCKHPHSTHIWSSVPYIHLIQAALPFTLEVVEARAGATLYLVPWPAYHKAHWLLQLLLLPGAFWVA
ncbi:hypothetical protein F5148DRAFT_1266117 [Russula earlei]|uniref:Uncharacterized protein n=1 Tax=Russula earlei TaxID=71964 RepID=A0ACC0TR93_9AGAM|nr:hypothetical protein F5148DRAFT_1266117 [Russula earlei]